VALASIKRRRRVRRDGTGYWVYRAQVPHPKGGKGSTRKLEKTFHSKKRAEKWVKDHYTALASGSYIEPDKLNTSLRQVAKEWVKTWDGKGTYAPSTEKDYRGILNKYVLPRFGDDAVGQITAEDIQTWLDKLAKHKSPKRKSPSTVAHYYVVLRNILKLAKSRGYIAANPCTPDAISLPSKTRGPHVARKALFLEHEELDDLLEALPEWWRLPVALDAFTGLRSGELWALTRARHRLAPRGATRQAGAQACQRAPVGWAGQDQPADGLAEHRGL
jgi:integrase